MSVDFFQVLTGLAYLYGLGAVESPRYAEHCGEALRYLWLRTADAELTIGYVPSRD